MRCHWCGSTHLRTSRFRMSDLPRLLLFQYPVRCQVCYQRGFSGFITVLRLQNVPALRPNGKDAEKASRPPRRSRFGAHAKCRSCGSARLRTSRFHWSDLPRLLRLQYPVRCRYCRERSYRAFWLLGRLSSGPDARPADHGLEDAPRGI